METTTTGDVFEMERSAEDLRAEARSLLARAREIEEQERNRKRWLEAEETARLAARYDMSGNEIGEAFKVWVQRCEEGDPEEWEEMRGDGSRETSALFFLDCLATVRLRACGVIGPTEFFTSESFKKG